MSRLPIHRSTMRHNIHLENITIFFYHHNCCDSNECSTKVDLMNHDNAFNLINNLSFCVFDLETTGGNQNSDKIIEIGLVKIDHLKIVQHKNYLIRPEVHIPEFIQKLTSIKEEDVSHAPLIEDVIDEILLFMGDSILVAHNTSFDVPFFNSVLKRLGREELKNKSICTNLMTKYMIPNILSSNLNYMSKIFGLKHHKAHRALDDALATAELLLKYLSIFIDKDVSKINHLYYPKNKFELDRIHFKNTTPYEDILSKIKLITCPFLVTFKGKEGIVLYAFPSHGTENEFQFIAKKMQEICYETLTIKLEGPYLKALIEFSSLYPKINQKDQSEILNFLCNQNNIEENILYQIQTFKFDYDFFIIHHLIPEQYIIYPVESLHQKLDLVFRYPSHFNKLLQYINSKLSKVHQDKMKKDVIAFPMKNLLLTYLERSEEHFKINRTTGKINATEFKTKLENFMQTHENTFQFPTNFL